MKTRKPIEVGMKVWAVDVLNKATLGFSGRVIEVGLGDAFLVKPESQNLDLRWVHRRQITKVWRKKPKPVARERWLVINAGPMPESVHHYEGSAKIKRDRDGGIVIHVREVLP